MTIEEELIDRYFDAFNQHDIDAVMACFHEHPVIVDPTGKRWEGRDVVRRHYETGFDLFPDGRCDLRLCTGNSGRAVAESRFRGTRTGRVVEALGAGVMEIADAQIKESRAYPHPSAAKTHEAEAS